MLAYGASADFLDDYVRMGESTIIECLKHFAKAVVEVFSEQYLRAPNAEDTARLMAINHARGWPGMLGSINYSFYGQVIVLGSSHVIYSLMCWVVGV